jgi:hypothetical protein
MTNDDEVVDPQDPIDPLDPKEPNDPIDPVDPQEDFRGKLNATNRFLQKEGYKFNETTKQWDKPTVAAKPHNPQVHSEIKTDNLSPKDIVELAKVAADVHEDDLQEVLDWAKFKNISPTEAKKQLKSQLESKDEQRKTASVANVTNARRGPTKLSGEEILDKARKGWTPDSEEDIDRLVSERYKTRQ